MLKEIKFDHYFIYDELTRILKDCEKRYPNLMRLSSICTTPKGREVWAVEITNLQTGDFLSKPAYYIDGNHHAGEVTGSMAAMHTLLYLLSGYGMDEKVTKLLDQNTVYVLPRISPDGAEAYLTTPEKLRSVDRPYPFEKRAPGLHPKDLDGDGIIRMMRVPSPYGVWKVSEKDERVMVKRSPSDIGGTYYNVYPEGDIEDYNGLTITMAPNKWGLDFNRNYPLGWFPEVRQPGAGNYPLSNPENKAVVEFVLSHPNIGSAVTHHTTGGIIIYPPGTKPEKDAAKRDMKMFREVGKMGTEEMGYDCLNIFDNFLPDQVNYSSGAYDDWLYQTQGIPAYTVELWDLMIRAGVKDVWPRTEKTAKTDAQKEEDFLLALQWLDKNVGKDAVKPWTPFVHPQLGQVDIGGYDFKFTVQNCPPAYLQQEVEKTTRFCLRHAFVLPRVIIDSLKSEKIGEGVYRVEAVLVNHGYLPTFITQEALNMKVDRQIEVDLSCSGEIITGKSKEKIGHLEGFAGIDTSYSYDVINTTISLPLQKKMEWVVKASAGSKVTLCVHSAKIGKIEKNIEL